MRVVSIETIHDSLEKELIMKVMWYSRFSVTERQMAELRRLYGAEVQIVHKTINNVVELVSDYQQSGADDLVFIGPMAVLEIVFRLGLRPLWAQSVPCEGSHPECDVTTDNGRHFRFVRFERIVELGLRYAPKLEPLCGVRRVLVLMRHDLRAEGESKLRRLYRSELTIVQPRYEQNLTANAVRALMREYSAGDIVLVAPLTIFDELCRSRIYPIQAKIVQGRQVLQRVSSFVFTREPVA